MVRGCDEAVNSAVADPAPVRTQVAVPLHAPLQPLKTAPAEGVAVSVTERWNIPVQLSGHEIPAGLLVTVPGPFTVTAREYRGAR